MTGSVERKFQIVKKFLDNSEFKQDILGMFFAEILSNSQLDEAGKILNLIAQGESKTVEWKSTLRYCLKTKENKKSYVEHAVVKTIAAFLNSKPGGTLLIGIGEDEKQKGYVHGIELDNFKSGDEAERHIINIINRDIGDLWSVNVEPKAIEIDGKKILKVKVDRANKPAKCKKGDDLVFYVRQGPTTKALSDEIAEEYINERW